MGRVHHAIPNVEWCSSFLQICMHHALETIGQGQRVRIPDGFAAFDRTQPETLTQNETGLRMTRRIQYCSMWFGLLLVFICFVVFWCGVCGCGRKTTEIKWKPDENKQIKKLALNLVWRFATQSINEWMGSRRRKKTVYMIMIMALHGPRNTKQPKETSAEKRQKKLNSSQ